MLSVLYGGMLHPCRFPQVWGIDLLQFAHYIRHVALLGILASVILAGLGILYIAKLFHVAVLDLSSVAKSGQFSF